jgi:hypothetical protein
VCGNRRDDQEGDRKSQRSDEAHSVEVPRSEPWSKPSFASGLPRVMPRRPFVNAPLR